MAVPYLGNALKGWTTKRGCKIITQSVDDFETVETPSDITANVNIQPMPAAKVNRKPEEQRTWSWWSMIIKSRTILLKTDDIILIGTSRYKVQSANDWRESGFSKYETIEDYEVST